MMKERWAAVLGFAGFYEVSNIGRVQSLDRTVTSTNGSIRTTKGRILKQTLNEGYFVVSLSAGQKKRLAKVHQLVLEAFKGLPPKGMICRHRNGHSTDNRLSNLRYGTHLQNQRDRRRHATDPKGSRNGRAKLTEENVTELRQNYQGIYGELVAYARKFGVHTLTIKRALRGENWR
jgi:hypothetical protein